MGSDMRILTITLFILLLSSTTSFAADTGDKYKVATFAGGCFWCLESDMDKVSGVIETISGYMGGHLKNPSYKQVSAGTSGHTEVVQITYDPDQVTYQQLLDKFWMNIDPTVKDQQFCDRGSQYRSAIFYHDLNQKHAAEQSLADLQKNKPFKGEIYTELSQAQTFYAAEEYHQDYYKKNPIRYNYYRFSCGRDKRLEEIWGARH